MGVETVDPEKEILSGFIAAQEFSSSIEESGTVPIV